MKRFIFILLTVLSLSAGAFQSAEASSTAGINVILRRGTAAAWTAANPILANGEPGYETDTGRMKLGNGVSRWSAISYFSAAVIPTPPNPQLYSTFSDASGGGQTVDIATYTDTLTCKIDNSVNTVTIVDTTPNTVNWDPLSVEGECLHLVLHSNGVWYKE